MLENGDIRLIVKLGLLQNQLNLCGSQDFVPTYTEELLITIKCS